MGDTVEESIGVLHGFFRFIFTHIMMGPLMLLVSLVIIFQWHLRKAFVTTTFAKQVKTVLGRPSTHFRMLGLNILILQFYFDPDMPEFVQKRKFVFSVFAVIFDTIILRYGARHLAYRVLAEDKDEELRTRFLIEQAEEGEQDPRWDDDPDAEPSGDMTESLYMDLTVAFHSIFPIFIVQLALMAFYMNELNDPGSDTKDQKNVEFGYWIVGVMIQVYAGGQQLGSPYNQEFWTQVRDSKQESTVERLSKRTVKIYDLIPLSYAQVWKLRSWMDYLINSVARDIIMYTFPIMLCVEGPLDFVKDCCAVFFITTLDDTDFSKSKTIPQMMVRLKFNIFYDQLKTSRGEKMDIPLKFTKEEAQSAEWDPNVWDQFENQREYVSPYIQEEDPDGGSLSLLKYMMKEENIQADEQ